MAKFHGAEPNVLLKHGVRYVLPYFHEYRTPFKERWRGRSAPEVLQSELGQTEPAIKQAIDLGLIFVSANNGKSGGPRLIKGPSVYTRPLEGHDIIHNIQHCHEPNVRMYEPSQENLHERYPGDFEGDYESCNETKHDLTALCHSHVILDSSAGCIKDRVFSIIDHRSQVKSPDEKNLSYPKNPFSSQKISVSGLDIIFADDEIVVVNKPGGVPTHPGGIYRYNTMSEILAHDLKNSVWPCHRLDKSTSGIMVFAKSRQISSKYMKLFSEKTQVEKWYVARVKGKFPFEACVYTCPVFSINTTGKAYINVSDASKVATNSETEFFGVHYDAERDCSIVLCRPVTGRMHQIRIHLRNLGHPIVNDGFYNSESETSRDRNALELEIYQKIWDSHPEFALPKLLDSEFVAESRATAGVEAERQVSAQAPAHAQVQSAMSSRGPKHSKSSESSKLHTPATVSVTALVDLKIQSAMKRLSEDRKANENLAISGTCDECSRPLYEALTELDSGIWLHALALRWRPQDPQGQGQGSVFVAAPFPAWCA